MTNQLVVVTYSVLIAIVALTIFFAYIRDRNKLVTIYLIRLCVITICWQIFAALHFLVNNEAFALWIFDAKLVFVAFAPVQLLLLSYKFYSAKSSRRTVLLFCILSILPAITAILAVTSPFHRLLRAELYFVQFQPLRILNNVRGTWFWIHSAYSYVMMLSSIFIVLYYHTKLPRGFRIPSMLVAIGSAIALFSNVFVLFSPYSQNIDLTLVGLSVALVFTYAGITISDESSLLVQAFDNIFTYLEDYIFILNNNRLIIELNPAAKNWLNMLGMYDNLLSFDELLLKLNQNTTDVSRVFGTGEQDFHLMIGQQVSHYNLSESTITDQSGRTIGTFAIFTDITRYRLLIERIEESAGIDPLTNLGNRRSYEQALDNLDEPTSLPFSVILGDVNGLKLVNDSMGHAAGDGLLRTIAEILRDACPEGMLAYRIGGDEFVMLMPNTSTDDAAVYVADIRKVVAEKNNEDSPYKISIALGIATKDTTDQDILECIAIADKNMYLDKENDRRSR